MRRLKLFLLSLACLSLPMGAFAQLSELDGKMITMASNATAELVPDNQWYIVYCWWQHKSGALIQDQGLGNPIMLSESMEVVWNGMLAKYAADCLVRFVSTDKEASDLYDKYYFQFGTGNFIKWPTSGEDYSYIYPCATIAEANTIYVRQALGLDCYFWLSTTDTDYRIDNYGPGGRLIVGSYQGDDDEADYLDDVYYLIPVTLTEVSGVVEASLELENALAKYVGYLYTFDDNVGTTPGSYREEDVQAFYNALFAAGDAIEDPDSEGKYTEEELRQMAQDIEDTYNAIFANMIPRQIDVEDGYYFFVSCARQFADFATDPYTKGLYSQVNSDASISAMWKTLERNAKFLWKVTGKGNSEYEMTNMATNATFNNLVKWGYTTMSQNNGNLVAFDYDMVYSEAFRATAPGGEYDWVNVRVSTQPADDYFYVHCADWDGTEGRISGCNWDADDGQCSWQMQPVSEEEALAIIEEYGDADTRNMNAASMIEDGTAKLKLANNGLIISVSQLYSPNTKQSVTAGYEYECELASMIDGDPSTYWHLENNSSYPGYVKADDIGAQYFQVQLLEEHGVLDFEFVRRNGYADYQITLLSVYGVPFEGAEKEECDFLEYIDLPFTAVGETLTGDFDSNNYTTLRFYIESTTSGSTSTHIAEFQLYDSEDTNSQRYHMGDVYDNLVDAIAAANAEGGQDLTDDTYDALKSAYDAFIAVFVDPTPLRTAISEANSFVSTYRAGSNPGEWGEDSGVSGLNEAIDEATAYLAAGVYTEETMAAYVEQLQSIANAISDSYVRVQEGKWYEIRYATRDEITANVWNRNNGSASSTSDDLFGKYVTVADLVVEDDLYTVDPLGQSQLEDICVGQNLYFLSMDDILYEDYAKFRFINVGDTAYMIQNKATGLFLSSTGTGSDVTLSAQPSLFVVDALGYGENLISASALDGTSQANLFAQVERNVLVTSTTEGAGTNAGLYIEDTGDIEDSYDGTDFNIGMRYGAITTLCYPVEVQVNTTEGTMYGVYVDGTTVTLAPMEDGVAEAGQPFVFVLGSLDGYEEDDDEVDPIPFKHSYELQTTAQRSGQLVGTYYRETIGSGKLQASGNTFTVTASLASYANANTAYIDGDFSYGDEITVIIGDETFDSIETAIASVAQNGNIYSVDGRLLGSGDLNTVKKLGKGIYIVNGVKVAVK